MTERASDPEAPTPVDQPRVVVTGKGPNLCFGVCVEINGAVRVPVGNKPIALCACGLSQNMPFCDSSHKLVNDTTETETLPPEET